MLPLRTSHRVPGVRPAARRPPRRSRFTPQAGMVVAVKKLSGASGKTLTPGSSSSVVAIGSGDGDGGWHRLAQQQAEGGAHGDGDQARSLPDGQALELVLVLQHLLAEAVLRLAGNRRDGDAGVQEGAHHAVRSTLAPRHPRSPDWRPARWRWQSAPCRGPSRQRPRRC